MDSRSSTPPPPWLVEGTTQIVMDIEFTDRSINLGRLETARGTPATVGRTGTRALGGSVDAGSMIVTMSKGSGQGRVSDGSGGESGILEDDPVIGDRQFNVVLANRTLMPFEQFFAITADSPEARNPLGRNLWAKQACAFVHMCLFREDAKFQKAYVAFVRRLANEPVSETLFKECFSLSYREMLEELWRHIRNPRHKYHHVELTREGRLVAEDVEFREATQGEVGRIKGDAQWPAGRRADAVASYFPAWARGDREPRLLGAFGVGMPEARQTDRARELLEAAVKAHTDRPSTCVALVRLRLDAARAKPNADQGRLDAAQVAAVLVPLLHARSIKPESPEAYEVMAAARVRC
jgi:hypothetical protein